MRRAPGGGRKPKLVCDEDTILKIRHLANIQGTKEEAAGALLVSESTFSLFLHGHIKAREAWDLGRHEGRASLRRVQWKLAQRSPAMAIWLGKQYLGQKDKTPPMNALLMAANAGAVSRKGNVVARVTETVNNKVAGADLAGNAVPSTEMRRRAPGGGRKPKLVCDKDTILTIRHLAKIQCTKEEAAGALLVSERTFSLFLHGHIKAHEAWDLGRHEGRASLRRVQWKLARRSPAMAIWLGKQYLGQKRGQDPNWRRSE